MTGTDRGPADARTWDVLREVARELGASEVLQELDATARRLDEGRFHVAFLGQFKRGKSMVMNALLGEPVMPVGVTPVTSAVVVVRHGPLRTVHVDTADGRSLDAEPEELARFVTEEQNPGNRLGVRRVEVLLPNELLADGLCLVDTPGIGSVFAANTAETRAFLPQIDVAVAVLGADPPISGEELRLLEELADRVHDVILVMNKADRLTSEDVGEAGRFTSRVVGERLGRTLGPLLVVSAKEALETRSDTRDWAAFRGRLEDLARRSGVDVVRAATRRAVQRLGRQLVSEIDEQRAALTRTLEQTALRVESLRTCTADAARSLTELAYVLQAEQDRFDRRLDGERVRLLEVARAATHARLATVASALQASPAELRRSLARAAQEEASSAMRDWNERFAPVAAGLLDDVARRFVDHAERFAARMREAAPDLAPGALDVEHGLGARRGYHFNARLTVASPSLLAWLGDRLLPREVSARRVARWAARYLDDLLETNSHRATNDYKERLLQGRRELESGLRRRLREVVARAERAHERAKAVQALGTEEGARRIAALDALRVKLEPASGGDLPALLSVRS